MKHLLIIALVLLAGCDHEESFKEGYIFRTSQMCDGYGQSWKVSAHWGELDLYRTPEYDVTCVWKKVES